MGLGSGNNFGMNSIYNSYTQPTYFGNPMMMGMGYGGRPNPYGFPMIVNKNYLIENNGPTADHHRLAMIFEDILPAKPFVPSSTTMTERLDLYQFVRSSILSNEDGENINLDGTMKGGSQSLLSYIKFDDMNPYNSYKLSDNKYMGMPEGFLIYRTCYPIRENRENYGEVVCAKDSTAINVRIYKMTEGSFLLNKGKTIAELKFSDFDEWREVAFYEYIRENIIKKKICPNFAMLYGYFISENCGIDFDAIEVAKFGKNTFDTKNLEYVYVNELGQIQNNTNVINNNLNNKSNVNYLKQYLYPYDTYINETNKNNTNIINNIKKSNIFETNKNFTVQSNQTNSINPINLANTERKIKYADDSGQILEIDVNAYKGKTLVLLTESGTQNLISWNTRTYQKTGNVKNMINRGHHNEQEWMNVLFQIMAGLYAMERHKIFIRNFDVEKNVLIKDLQIRGAITNYWKYKIDDIDYYIPNLGYLVLIDSNFKDIEDYKTKQENTINTNKNIKINNNITIPNKFNKKIPNKIPKLDGKIISDTLSDGEIQNNVLDMFKNVFDPNVFSKEFQKKGSGLPEKVKKLIENINSNNSNNGNSIKDYFVKYMGCFLNNRIGTYLKEIEILNIRKEDSKDFKRGQIIVYEEGYLTYKFVMYLSLNSHDNTHNIITKENPTQSDTILKLVDIGSLHQYSKAEPITQNYKPNEANLNDDDLLETYILK